MTGIELKEALASVREFHQSISHLLLTADGLMDEAGIPLHPHALSQAVTLQSMTIGKPSQWMPEFVFRWYDLGETHRAAYIAAVLLQRRDDNKPKGVPTFVEPLVSYGVASFADGVPPSSKLYHFARAILWTPVQRDGQHWGYHWPSQARHGYVVVESGAVPLTHVTDSPALQTQVIQPLCARLQTTQRTPIQWVARSA